MGRILLFTKGPQSWQALLADPGKQWKQGYSARTLAYCWEAADGLPPEIAAVFQSAFDPMLRSLQPVIAIPEYKVGLPGGTRSSQNDVFVLARVGTAPVTIAVEGKVDESFGPTVAEWVTDKSPGKGERMQYLLDVLGLSAVPDGAIRYQLLHRCASPLIEAERFHAVAAVMLVHSFSAVRTGWTDFRAFCGLFGVDPEPGKLTCLTTVRGVPLYVGWVDGDRQFTKA